MTRFSPLKFILILFLVLISAGTFYSWRAYSGATLNVTINSNPDLENGLVAHWTFDGPDMEWGTETGDSGTEVWRPNAEGGLTEFIVSGCSSNFECVDETSADDDTTYVYESTTSQDDYYDTSGTEQTGTTISNVELTTRVKTSGGAVVGTLAPGLRVDASNYLGSASAWTSSYTNQTDNWATNPATEVAWTWSDIDALQIGFTTNILAHTAAEFRVTQDFFTVSYNEAGSTGTSTDRVGGFNGLSYGMDETNGAPGRIGQALIFEDGDTSSYLDVGTGPSSVKTIAFWINTTDASSEIIMDINGSDELNTNGSDQITASSFPGTVTYFVDGVSGDRIITDGNWHHVVVTDTTGVNASNLDIGRDGTDYLGGKLDDVRMYDRILSDEEIKRVYQLGATTHINQTLTVNPDLENGLIAHWTMDGPDLINNVADRSGNNNHGVLNGFASTTTTPGRLGQALHFDGSNDRIDTGKIVPTGDFTYATWLYHDDANVVSNEAVFSYSNSVSGNEMFIGITTANKVNVNLDIITSFNSSQSIVPGVWHHLVVKRSGSAITIYVDDVLDGTSGTDGDTLDNTCTLVYIAKHFGGNLGCDGLQTFHNFDGKLDDFRIYSRALSDNEINRLYGLGATTHINKTLTVNPDLENSLVAHWTFDGPHMISNVTDRAGSFDGALTNQTPTTTIVGRLGQALDFDGSDDYIDVGTGPSNAKTIAFWINATEATSESIMDVDGTDEITTNASDQITATSFPGTIVYYVDGVSGDRVISNNVWNHVVITDTTGVNASNLDIGRIAGAYFGGKIDDVRMYSKVLTSSEVSRLYDLGR